MSTSILVAVASKHGSTREIAEVIGEELRAHGVAADVRDIEETDSIAGYDAVVCGSAIYMGNWLPEAYRFIDRHHQALARVPVWLFSSGPLGETDPQPVGDPVRLPGLMDTTGAREHRMFVGKLDKSELGFMEKLATKVVKAPEGDFRDWEAIRAWAREIATMLASSGVAEPVAV